MNVECKMCNLHLDSWVWSVWCLCA
jgi:hypothetical protein